MDHNYTKYRELQPNDTVLILGAYDGDFIRERKDEIISKNIFVINVEPDIRLCRIVMEFIEKEMPLNATALNIAISDRSGANVFQNCNNTLISRLKDLPASWPEDTSFETKILTLKLDDITSMYDINCIFCDIEGAELEVFRDCGLISICCCYIAIAAYHIRDGEKTFKKLSNYFKIFPSKKMIIDSENNEEVLYLI